MNIQETIEQLDTLEKEKDWDFREERPFTIALLNAYPALREEIKRLEGEVERLKQTSVEIEKPDGSKAYIQMHCTYPHDHFIAPEIGVKML